jgi:hypothetical protein
MNRNAAALTMVASLFLLSSCNERSNGSLKPISDDDRHPVAPNADGRSDRAVGGFDQRHDGVEMERTPIVLSSIFGICINPGVPVNVNFESAGDFTPGQIRIGSGSSFRRIDYGVGLRFEKGLRYVPLSLADTPYQVYTADQVNHGVTNVKVIGMGKVPGLELIFSYPIGDQVALAYIKTIISELTNCKVVHD